MDSDETHKAVEQVREMIRDVESSDIDPRMKEWSLGRMRSALAQLEEMERDERWIEERLALRGKRMAEIKAKSELLKQKGVSLPKAGVSASKTRRYARRVRNKEAEPDLPDDVRAEKARAIDESVDVQQEILTLQNDIARLIREIAPVAEKSQALHHEMVAEERAVAREFGETEKLREMNRKRRQDRARRRKKKKKK